METSILLTIKKALGVADGDTGFDTDIILAINTVFMSLNQLGVGPDLVFHISDENDNWADFLIGATDLEAVKSYILFKTRLMFDPPTSGFLVEAIKAQALELEWRLQVQAEPPAA